MSKVVTVCFHEILGFLTESVKNAMHLCLYIDFPFCRSNCLYCIYNSLPYSVLTEHRENYVSAVYKQLERFHSVLSENPIESVYFGGGTPSLWTEDELSGIIKRIPHFSTIKSIKSEMHPFDITDQRVKFYAEKLNLNVASLGVQSLNADSCRGQHRLYVDEDKLKHIVDEFHKYGIYVNIDLVALFNGDTENDWHIFENDLHSVVSYIKPDVITSIPNYRTKLDYLSQIPRFRQILASACSDIYVPINPSMLSLDAEDIKRYGRNDHWIGTEEYFAYIRENFKYCCSAPHGNNNVNNQTTIAIGGAGNHLVYSYTADGRTFYSAYSFDKKDFVYYRLD